MMEISKDSLFQSVKEIIRQSREKVFRIANSTLLLTYWQIGKLIVEDEQQGKERAEYGKYTLKNLSQKLTLEFGKGFDYTNLSNMCKFYIAFPIVDTLSQQLSWSHYRLLSSQDDKNKRQINSLTYERVSDETIVKYSVLNDKNNLFASKYLLYLPKEEELKQIIDQDRIRFELDQDNKNP